MYLHYTSSHPVHCKTSLPYSQFLRTRRICTRHEDFEVNARTMVKYLLDRGYPQELITSSLSKAQNQERSELLTPKNTDLSQPTKNDSLFPISTYHPSVDGLKTTINTHWDYLTRNMTTRSIHTQRNIFGYHRLVYILVTKNILKQKLCYLLHIDCEWPLVTKKRED